MMSDIRKFYGMLNDSDVSLICYETNQETIKDELISKLPSYGAHEVDSSFNLKSIERDIKINSILIGSINAKFIIIDLNKLEIRDKVSLGKCIDNIIYQFYNSKYRLILTSALTGGYMKNPYSGIGLDFNLKVGLKPLYMSDICLVVRDGKIEVSKDRYTSKKQIIDIDGLKEYNYEYSK
jgi:hypothetical protein